MPRIWLVEDTFLSVCDDPAEDLNFLWVVRPWPSDVDFDLISLPKDFLCKPASFVSSYNDKVITMD